MIRAGKAREMRLLGCLIALCAWLSEIPDVVGQTAAVAGETSIATIGLRGGHDSNPADTEKARGSPFSTQVLTWEYSKGSAKDAFGISVNATNTYYNPQVSAASLNNSVAFTAAAGLAENLVLRGALTASNEQTWSRRQNSVLLKQRLEYETGDYRLFASLEGKLSALNERNYFALGSFLPRDENFATVTALPGAAYKTAYGEIGLSFSASHITYLEHSDYLGFRRDHDRLQPNLFYAGKFGGITLEGSVSGLDAQFPAKDFENVRRVLYTAKIGIPFGIIMLDLASSRAVADTTLPFSVIDIVDQHEARLTARYWDRNAVSLFARQKTDDYIGLDAKAKTRSFGLEYARKLDGGLTATASITARRVLETGVTIPDALNFQIGVQKQFDFGVGTQKKG